MNRIVLIGNGFDLAHGLPTNYESFIQWYWERCGNNLLHGLGKEVSDGLCSFKINDGIDVHNWASVFQGWYYKRENPLIPWDLKDVVRLVKEDKKLCDFKISQFLQQICNNIETKKWVDIENEYYKLLTKHVIAEPSSERLKELNGQLQYIQKLLTEYLSFVCQNGAQPIERLWKKVYMPINSQDISINGFTEFRKYIDNCLSLQSNVWEDKQSRYGLGNEAIRAVEDYTKNYERYVVGCYPDLYMLPDWVLFVNFNYTNTATSYLRKSVSCQVHIHGDLTNPESMIFEYGDEMDTNYLRLQNLNNNECLQNIKSIKYLESDNYRNVLSFIDSAPYQIYIMGHSCGNSDRTLLNTLFEHKNCISIKPYYYKKEDGTDNYLELVMNISRNFTDMKLMRDRVVNKTYCEPLLE